MSYAVYPDKSQKLINPADMEIGDLAIVQDSNSRFYQHILLRAYDQWISLNEPQSTWRMPPNFKVANLVKGDVVTLEVTD